MNNKKVSLYESVTNSLIEKIEAGVLPWQQGWKLDQPAFKLPVRDNGEKYKGINTLILWLQAIDKNYASNQWCSFQQAKENGWSVRKGEKATMVAYYSIFEKEIEGQDDPKKIPFLKTFPVFNYCQIDGAPIPDEAPTRIIRNQDSRDFAIEDFVFKSGARVNESGNRAFYSPGSDYIVLPKFEDFQGADYFYSTLFHELGHWTGHKNRLNRDFSVRFGDQKYAREEIVAELTAAFLCADFNVDGHQRNRSASYLESWLSVLKKDAKAIFSLSSMASRAAEYLHELQTREASKTAA